jgi:mRNA-degrading endonuclease toxin of MazEF toxin-antitoxin module
MNPQRGEIWWAHTGTKRRPVVVISSDGMNRRIAKVIVIPGTTNLRGWPDELIVTKGLLPDDTAFCCREVTPVSKDQLAERVGRVTEEWLVAACGVLSSVLGCRY